VVKHQHKEAFCLMTYVCQGRYDYTGRQRTGSGRIPRTQGCGHRETFWNSRDGVTPFGTTCPSCGGDLQHVNFAGDVYAPDHKPHHGQGVWRDGTKEEAVAIVKARRDHAKERGVDEDMVKRLDEYVTRVEQDLEPDWTRPWPILIRHRSF
jgi:hypothetical protein